MNKKHFNKPTLTVVTMATAQVIAASSTVDNKNDANGRGARQNNGGIGAINNDAVIGWE